ncbi:hypothetical protein RCH09_002771 [Actimicrobium sp. GrIS 1.19]|uniref:hypothetical protein n=1 Tax=Actimicrobium sp. GrIS 1.19 TaxID=3071708 RepID=UPI002E028BDC|nr:hypothetical protein [Actimicrobium sp. GrIS 1.19]
MNRITFLLVLAIAALPLAVFAAPAQYYRWQSKLDGALACQQTPPGDGWLRESGPYRDPHCKKLVKPADPLAQ